MHIIPGIRESGCKKVSNRFLVIHNEDFSIHGQVSVLHIGFYSAWPLLSGESCATAPSRLKAWHTSIIIGSFVEAFFGNEKRPVAAITCHYHATGRFPMMGGTRPVGIYQRA
jgi:hypothetical protein